MHKTCSLLGVVVKKQQQLSTTSDNAGTASFVPTPSDVSEQIYLAHEINTFTEESVIRRPEDKDKKFQCLICASVQRDLFNFKGHVLTHMTKDNEFAERLNVFVRRHAIEHHKQMYTCLLCKKVFTKDFYNLRTHFVTRHLKEPGSSLAPY